MYQIRYYQEEAILSLYNYFVKQAGNPVVALPTGTGKSVVIAEWLRSIFTYYPGQRVMMLTHVKELIQQNYEELTALWPLAPAGVFSAGLGRKEVRPITFAGIASVVKKAELFGHIDQVLIDECHLVSPHDETSYQNFIADLRVFNPHLKVIGLTATPYRVGQGLLTNSIETKSGPRPSLFTDICYDITGFAAFNRLIDEGYLCRLTPKRTDQQLDISKVGTSMGEFKLDELQQAVDREEITRRAITEICEQAALMPHGSGRPRCRWLIFATGIDHAGHVANEMLGRGLAVRCVTSKTPKGERDAAVKWFKEESDDIRVIVNNGVFTTGFNCRQLDLIGVLRPTNSPGLWVQMLGRGTRPYDGKDDCLVLDFAGNSKRLGPINDPVIPRRKGMKGGGDAPVKICEKCNCYNHASVRFCTACGWEFPKAVRFQDHASTEEILRSDKPLVEIFAVTHTTYDRHEPHDRTKPPSMKVVYHCGKFQKFSEWVCFEHGGLAGEKARKWWQRATKIQSALPHTTAEALTRRDELAQPTHVRVWINSRHPRVMDQDYSGTAFRTLDSSGKPQKVAV